jgi:hypothetical protein
MCNASNVYSAERIVRIVLYRSVVVNNDRSIDSNEIRDNRRQRSLSNEKQIEKKQWRKSSSVTNRRKQTRRTTTITSYSDERRNSEHLENKEMARISTWNWSLEASIWSYQSFSCIDYWQRYSSRQLVCLHLIFADNKYSFDNLLHILYRTTIMFVYLSLYSSFSMNNNWIWFNICFLPIRNFSCLKNEVASDRWCFDTMQELTTKTTSCGLLYSSLHEIVQRQVYPCSILILRSIDSSA